MREQLAWMRDTTAPQRVPALVILILVERERAAGRLRACGARTALSGRTAATGRLRIINGARTHLLTHSPQLNVVLKSVKHSSVRLWHAVPLLVRCRH